MSHRDADDTCVAEYFVHPGGPPMRRLENEDEEKFWEAWIKDDLIFCYRYGKIGSAGHTKLKKFKTKAEAEAELEEKLAEKLEEGFEEPGAEEAEEEEAEEEEAEEEEAEEEEAEEEEAEEEEAEEEEGDDGDEDKDDEDADEEDDSDEDEDEGGDDEDDAPRKKGRATAPVVVDEPPPKPSLPARMRASTSTPTPERLDAAVKALEALRAATMKGLRSWRLARLARRARHALEALHGAELAKYEAVDRALDAVMAAVISSPPAKRLPLEDALTLLWVVDVATYARVVGRWRAKMPESAVKPSIGVLVSALESIPDQEVAVHVGTALVNRRLSPEAFQHWFSRLKPFLVEALASAGGVAAFRATLEPGKDAILKARVGEVVP